MVLVSGCIKIEMAGEGTTAIQNGTGTSEAVQINTFQAVPDSIKPGESSTLSWEVSGSDMVTISPEVGPVKPSGTADVSPQTTTTYVLEVAGAAGKTNKSVTVKVDEAVMKPDLVITDLYIQVEMVYFKVKNIGNAPSKGCRAYLYLDGTKLTDGDTYIKPLDPGQEGTEVFGKYAWKNPMETENLPLPLPKLIQWELMVCADTENTIDEQSEKNNCKSVIMGQELLYKFYEKAHLASWVSGSGKIDWPTPAGNIAGSAFTMESKVLEDNKTHGSIIAAYPQKVINGWISGTFSDYYTVFSGNMKKDATRLLEIPRHCKFTADVGFIKEAPDTAKAKFIFAILDQGGMPVYSNEIVAARNGELDSFDEDLSEFEGKTCTIVLRVESQSSPEDVLAVWSNAQLTQDW